ncbi:hypothetical protein SAMN05444392_11217 [Seinonella peptonophila]|uniref:Uncharacterized protein n=1 Tax=Seinonella peptonophila TaxID=112248 RepID=A0A1M5A502_9BACL|nr:hypothetical protein SAMN05444392_11217 [Seinonella peptonophila]
MIGPRLRLFKSIDADETLSEKFSVFSTPQFLLSGIVISRYLVNPSKILIEYHVTHVSKMFILFATKILYSIHC